MDARALSSARLLCSVNDHSRDGHGEDLRVSIKNALPNLQLTVLQDASKRPEHSFAKTLEQVLTSNVVLLDWLASDENNNAEKLVQFGIAYALKRPCALLSVVSNSQMLPEISCPLADNLRMDFDSYQDLTHTLLSIVSNWVEKGANWPKPERNSIPVQAFSVFGTDTVVQPDLKTVISEFAQNSEWRAQYYSLSNYSSDLRRLSDIVAARSFSIFCLSNGDNNSTYVAIGIAVGMGIPFLVLQNKSAALPSVLGGYDGIIQYSNYTELAQSFQQYTSDFLCNDVQNWNGASFFHLLTYIEERLSKTESVAEFDTLELTLQAVIGAVGRPIAKPYALLGDLCRQRNYRLDPMDSAPLRKAISHYQQALKVQPDFIGCVDKIAATDKYIQLIELLREKKYRSIPALIQLIGSAISSDYYREVREFLLEVVEELIVKGEHAHAISLLVSISQHDNSERVHELMWELLNTVPEGYFEAIRDAQEHINVLENQKDLLLSSITEKDELILKQYHDFELLSKKLVDTDNQLETIRADRDKLNASFQRNLGKLQSIIQEQQTLNEKIELSRELASGRGALVNFGFWAVLIKQHGTPQVYRGSSILPAQEGLVLIDNDKIYDESGKSPLWLIPPWYKIVEPS